MTENDRRALRATVAVAVLWKLRQESEDFAYAQWCDPTVPDMTVIRSRRRTDRLERLARRHLRCLIIQDARIAHRLTKEPTR